MSNSMQQSVSISRTENNFNFNLHLYTCPHIEKTTCSSLINEISDFISSSDLLYHFFCSPSSFSAFQESHVSAYKENFFTYFVSKFTDYGFNISIPHHPEFNLRAKRPRYNITKDRVEMTCTFRIPHSSLLLVCQLFPSQQPPSLKKIASYQLASEQFREWFREGYAWNAHNKSLNLDKFRPFGKLVKLAYEDLRLFILKMRYTSGFYKPGTTSYIT